MGLWWLWVKTNDGDFGVAMTALWDIVQFIGHLMRFLRFWCVGRIRRLWREELCFVWCEYRLYISPTGWQTILTLITYLSYRYALTGWDLASVPGTTSRASNSSLLAMLGTVLPCWQGLAPRLSTVLPCWHSFAESNLLEGLKNPLFQYACPPLTWLYPCWQ